MRNRTAGQKARSQGRSLAVVLTVFVVVGTLMLGTAVLRYRDAGTADPVTGFVVSEGFELPPAEEEPVSIAAIQAVSEVAEQVVHEEPVLADEKAFEDIIGIGGGAGVSFGGRFGGRRSFRSAGSPWPRGDSRFFYPGTEDYAAVPEAAFRRAAEHPLSTFAVDVDTASYTNVRRFLQRGRLPPAEAVRVEELLNYFRYDYPPPRDGKPLAVHIEVASCPWRPEHRLVHVGVQARAVAGADRKPANLVFLVDVSGSMRPENKLPLVKRGLELLLDGLDGDDRIAIVTYAQDACVVLDSTPASERQAILDVIDALGAGGSTNGGAGIDLAYDIATAHLLAGGNNRVILATDGDFNVGTTDPDALVALIEEKARSGVFLSVLGFGLGNLKDATLEQLADRGDGFYVYVDSFVELRRVFSDRMSGMLETVAKDVKIQVEFNPREVESYRLVGYDNRALAARDFNDDRKDAGDVGAGHAVTALYEVVPSSAAFGGPGVDPLKYQAARVTLTQAAAEGELLTLKLRWKEPDGDRSELLEVVAHDSGAGWSEASDDFRFAAAVASFGMILARSEHGGAVGASDVLELATSAVGADPHGERTAFLDLVLRANELLGS